MTDFAAIDFETANKYPTSVCSVGVVIVRKGVIVEEIYELIKPVPNWYFYANSRIHGLRKRDTDTARPFNEVWQKIAPKIVGLPLVAHNSRFDEGCLKASFAAYKMAYPKNYHFFCTCEAAKKKLGEEVENHRLPTVAAYFGYHLENHHHALADAEACAVIAQNLL